MTAARESSFFGARGRIAVYDWTGPAPRYVAVIAHGYGEHARRYDHVADHLVRHEAVVYAPDHQGHGRSEGERALVASIEEVVTDVRTVVARATKEHPGLPVVLIGHSMGGLIATRYAQRHGGDLTALVLSGPAIGGNPGIEALLTMDPIPDFPIDPTVLSRDPAVGRAYQDDPLVWHGPFRRGTLEALFAAIQAVAAGPSLGALPTLWMHGSGDALAPLTETRAAIERLRGPRLESIIWEGAEHEIFNETNRAEVLAAMTSFLDRVLSR
jgi:alpha-beta hydrolase superfamily lysophospholipase